MFVEDRSLNPGVETKADPFSLDSLIAWLEKQPSALEYVWTDVFDCLMHHYYTDVLRDDLDGEYPARMVFDLGCDFERPFGSISAYHKVAGSLPWTFGAALERARALKARHG